MSRYRKPVDAASRLGLGVALALTVVGCNEAATVPRSAALPAPVATPQRSASSQSVVTPAAKPRVEWVRVAALDSTKILNVPVAYRPAGRYVALAWNSAPTIEGEPFEGPGVWVTNGGVQRNVNPTGTVQGSHLLTGSTGFEVVVWGNGMLPYLPAVSLEVFEAESWEAGLEGRVPVPAISGDARQASNARYAPVIEAYNASQRPKEFKPPAQRQYDMGRISAGGGDQAAMGITPSELGEIKRAKGRGQRP